MQYAGIFVLGMLVGAVIVIDYALMVANTRYEDAARKVKTNADMMKLADKQQIAKAMKRLYARIALPLSPMLQRAQEKEIEKWLEKEADAEWKE